MKPFNQLTLRGQKMRIVRDAITQTNSNVIIPTRGVYLTLLDYLEDDESLKKALKQENIACEACAQGGLFIACVLNTNRVYGGDLYGNYDFQTSKLLKWFKIEEINTIEAAFEQHVVHDEKDILLDYGCKTKLAQRAVKFGLKYPDSTKRFLAILNNILKHGTFKP